MKGGPSSPLSTATKTGGILGKIIKEVVEDDGLTNGNGLTNNSGMPSMTPMPAAEQQDPQWSKEIGNSCNQGMGNTTPVSYGPQPTFGSAQPQPATRNSGGK